MEAGGGKEGMVMKQGFSKLSVSQVHWEQLLSCNINYLNFTTWNITIELPRNIVVIRLWNKGIIIEYINNQNLPICYFLSSLLYLGREGVKKSNKSKWNFLFISTHKYNKVVGVHWVLWRHSYYISSFTGNIVIKYCSISYI